MSVNSGMVRQPTGGCCDNRCKCQVLIQTQLPTHVFHDRGALAVWRLSVAWGQLVAKRQA